MVEHQEGCRIAEDAANVITEGKAKAEGHPQDRDDSHGNETLEHRGDNVSRADHAAIEKRQSRRHHQHEDRCRNHPSNISLVNL